MSQRCGTRTSLPWLGRTDMDEVTRLIMDFSKEEIAIIDEWRAKYLTSGIEDTRENALRDMVGKIHDDMRDMEED